MTSERITNPNDPRTLDPDLGRQARPGHGIPSQDPDPAAQHAISPDHAASEARTVYVGGGAVAGAATGAVVGTAVAGPLGTLVGGTIGAVAGAVGGAAVGATRPVEPEDTPGAP